MTYWRLIATLRGSRRPVPVALLVRRNDNHVHEAIKILERQGLVSVTPEGVEWKGT